MCGIAGATDDPDGRLVQAMCAQMVHRGPDDAGLHTDPASGVCIGARRLAILDLQNGHQPLANEDGSVWVAFNGEIYNHERLRESLRSQGHRFTTGTDTEVLVHLYEELGEELAHALEGMFAFAIWDARRRRLLLARDRFGEKPLFMCEQDGRLLFASELTALLAAMPRSGDLDPAAIDAFFVLGYVPGPETIVPGVRRLLPGGLAIWERGRGCAERKWWSPPAGDVSLDESVEAITAETERLLRESVRQRMIADVPVGVFLSGGIDSALVSALAARESSHRLQTFTIGYDVGPFDETAAARRVARQLQTEHHEVTLTQEDVATRVPELLSRLDQPLADQAIVPLHALCEFARPRVTVALGGEGADEVFGGYPRYRWMQRGDRLRSMLPEQATGALAMLPRQGRRGGRALRMATRMAPTDALERHLDWVSGERRWRRESLYGPALAGIDRDRVLTALIERAGGSGATGHIGRRLMRLDQIDYLPNNVLVKSDRAGMLHSLEVRTVYLHQGLVELAASVDPSLHLARAGKVLLHRMLPESLRASQVSRPYRKEAFLAPAAQWLRGPLAPAITAQVERGAICEQGFFDRDALRAAVREHTSGARDNSELLWPLLALGLWTDRFLGVDAS
jgi:asparagine synthase (glutamine-hydrolysing)